MYLTIKYTNRIITAPADIIVYNYHQTVMTTILVMVSLGICDFQYIFEVKHIILKGFDS